MKPYVEQKFRCTECYWRGIGAEVLSADNPFDPGDSVSGCPKCNGINTMSMLCEQDGCWDEATCGNPSKRGYMHTCGKHQPKE